MASNKLSIIMMGATGAVGTETIKELITFSNLKKLSLLGRRKFETVDHSTIQQHLIDVTDPDSYRDLIPDHHIAICTLGVGEPSKTSKEVFLKIDKQAVLDFAVQCKASGVNHFQLLSSVGISPRSKSFFLRTKGELVEELKALKFDRLSIFQPSMILTPTNRYGFSQAIVLAVWPILGSVLIGGLKKYKGIKVDHLGQAIARNILKQNSGVEMLTWSQFMALQK